MMHRQSIIASVAGLTTTVILSYYLYQYINKKQLRSKTNTNEYQLHYTPTSSIPTDSIQLTAAHTCSCSGKVLIAGGYLVLERPNVGLVLSVNARFYSSIAALTYNQLQQYVTPNTSAHDDSPTNRYIPIIVYTPQRHGMTPTVYELYFDGPSYNISTISLQQITSNTEHNVFVYNALLYTLSIICTVCNESMIHQKLLNGVIIYLNGDYQFYSAQPVNQQHKQDGKTGLGSSAALVSSLVAVLYNYFDVLSSSENREHTFNLLLPQPNNCKLINNDTTSISLSNTQCKQLAHHTSQFIHCLAQGKVGSGFDISAAYYGTQRYTRYSAQCIKSLIDRCIQQSHIVNDTTRLMILSYMLPNNINQLQHSTKYQTFITDSSPQCCVTCMYTQRYSWDYSIESLQLPSNLTLILGDVSGGTQTPSMVRNVLQWKSTVDMNNTCNQWHQLSVRNNKLDLLLRQLYTQSIDNMEYNQTCDVLCNTPVTQWSTIHTGNQTIRQLFSDINTTFTEIRQLLKSMGKECGAAIEPSLQSELLDATQSINGVLLCGVPGAGGDDAIFALVLSQQCIQLYCIMQSTLMTHLYQTLIWSLKFWTKSRIVNHI